MYICRRAVLQRQTTECILKELCTNPKKLCRGCRYKKCINMGMSIKGLLFVVPLRKHINTY